MAKAGKKKGPPPLRAREKSREKQIDKREGVLRARTREVAEQNAREGVTPLEVMLTNMRWAHDGSVGIMAQLVDFLELTRFEMDKKNWDDKEREKAEKAEARKEGMMVFRQFLRMRELAQKFAVDAAPYCHPRLAQVEYKQPGKSDIVEIRRTVIDAQIEYDPVEMDAELMLEAA